MINPIPMRYWFPILLPLALYGLTALLLAFVPESSQWPNLPMFTSMPYILLAVAFLLGLFFTQTRVSFICLLLAITTAVAHKWAFVAPDPVKVDTAILLSSIYIPLLTAVFFRSPERGLINVHGCVRMLLVASTAIIIALLPMIPNLSVTISSSASMVFRSFPESLHVPAIGLLSFACSIPVLAIRKEHESPVLGLTLLAGLLFVLTALAFRADFWRSEQRHTVFVIFMSGAATTLAWAVMETSWRNAHIDELTELPGRRSLKHRLAGLGASFSIAMLDIDRFKKINDKYGHDSGDQVLRFVAARLRKTAGGRAYRYGGEEFAIICEGMNAAETSALMEQLREEISGAKFVIRNRSRFPGRHQSNPGRQDAIAVTVSIGVAGRNERMTLPQEVIEAADKALYRAKKGGRNCVKTAR